MNYKIYCIIIFFIIQSCSFFNTKNEAQDKGKPLAKVNQTVLYQLDLQGLVPTNVSKEDSAEIVNRYINSWLRKQLLISKAQKEAKIDEAAIARKLLDYRYDLIAYEFEKAFIQKNLDTTVNEQDITKYYQENPANFELKQNIIQGILVQIPQNLKEAEDVKKALINGDNQKLKEYCVKFAKKYFLEDTKWTVFEDLIKESPFNQIINKVDFLKQNTFAETTDQNFTYFLKIKDYKIINQPAPLNFVRPRIINMINNQRKVALAKKLEQNLYEEAKKSQSFEVYK